MELNIIKIGNSKGIILPTSLLKRLKIGKRVSVEEVGNAILLKSSENPREGWAQAFRKMHKNGDDVLLDRDILDDDFGIEWK